MICKACSIAVVVMIGTLTAAQDKLSSTERYATLTQEAAISSALLCWRQRNNDGDWDTVDEVAHHSNWDEFESRDVRELFGEDYESGSRVYAPQSAEELHAATKIVILPESDAIGVSFPKFSNTEELEQALNSFVVLHSLKDEEQREPNWSKKSLLVYLAVLPNGQKVGKIVVSIDESDRDSPVVFMTIFDWRSPLDEDPRQQRILENMSRKQQALNR